LGPCMQVAKDIANGFKNLRGNPLFLRIIYSNTPVLGFETAEGATLQVANNPKAIASWYRLAAEYTTLSQALPDCLMPITLVVWCHLPVEQSRSR